MKAHLASHCKKAKKLYLNKKSAIISYNNLEQVRPAPTLKINKRGG